MTDQDATAQLDEQTASALIEQVVAACLTEHGIHVSRARVRRYLATIEWTDEFRNTAPARFVGIQEGNQK